MFCTSSPSKNLPWYRECYTYSLTFNFKINLFRKCNTFLSLIRKEKNRSARQSTKRNELQSFFKQFPVKEPQDCPLYLHSIVCDTMHISYYRPNYPILLLILEVNISGKMVAYGIDNGFGNTKTPCYCFYQQNLDYGVIKKPTFIVMLSCVQSDKGHNLVLLMKNQGVINFVMFRKVQQTETSIATANTIRTLAIYLFRRWNAILLFEKKNKTTTQRNARQLTT